MKRLLTWVRSYYRWLILAACSALLLIWLGWLLSLKTVATFTFIVIWLGHLLLGAGAGYATVRLWRSRHHPLILRLGLYMNAFLIDVISAMVILFVARGVKLTWKFTTVMFVSTLLSDIFRAPLIFYLIKGPTALPAPAEVEKSGEKPPQFWLDAFRQIVREEINRRWPKSKAGLSRKRPQGK